MLCQVTILDTLANEGLADDFGIGHGVAPFWLMVECWRGSEKSPHGGVPRGLMGGKMMVDCNIPR